MNYILRAILLSQQIFNLGMDYLEYPSNQTYVTDRRDWYGRSIREIASEPNLKIWNDDVLIGVY